MITLTARCHPALEPILPKPVLAADALPDWLRTMPSEVDSETLGGAPIRTLKHCPPLIDALGLGLLMPLAADLTVRAGEVSWHWDPPPLPADLLTRAPIGLHVPEQAAGTPLPVAGFIIKFTNFWTLEAPEGWSILFTHPLNREDLPFRTLAGAHRKFGGERHQQAQTQRVDQRRAVFQGADRCAAEGVAVHLRGHGAEPVRQGVCRQHRLWQDRL